MNTFISKIKIAALLCGISGFSVLALAGEMKDTGTSGAGQNKIEIKDFAFNPQTITVKSGDKITWINRDEEPHTVVSVGKKFQRSSGLDTDQEFSIIAGAPGTYEYFCSVHPKMTGTIVVVKP
jgi:plastocyanin